jgi:hypothetical protein
VQHGDATLNLTHQVEIEIYLGGEKMLLLIGIVLFVVWILGFTAFHVAGGLIHLLLLFAVISFVAHLIMGRRATV